MARSGSLLRCRRADPRSLNPPKGTSRLRISIEKERPIGKRTRRPLWTLRDPRSIAQTGRWDPGPRGTNLLLCLSITRTRTRVRDVWTDCRVHTLTPPILPASRPAHTRERGGDMEEAPIATANTITLRDAVRTALARERSVHRPPSAGTDGAHSPCQGRRRPPPRFYNALPRRNL